MEDNKEAIPERFVSVVTEEEYKKSINYNTERITIFNAYSSYFGWSFVAIHFRWAT